MMVWTIGQRGRSGATVFQAAMVWFSKAQRENLERTQGAIQLTAPSGTVFHNAFNLLESSEFDDVTTVGWID